MLKNYPQINYILGIDYGSAKIGVALADMETKIAFVYTTLKNDKNIFQNLTEIIKKENVKMAVIGAPRYIYKQKIKKSRDSFSCLAENLKNLGIVIEFQEEMFTTETAKKNLIEKGIKNIRRFDDQEAARVILQEWLDKSA